MKRKVQAQRKFAQGAYIPHSSTNSNQNTSADKVGKLDHTTPKHSIEKPKRRLRTTTTAKRLLDKVCFENLHTHMTLIVLLERLKETNPSLIQLRASQQNVTQPPPPPPSPPPPEPQPSTSGYVVKNIPKMKATQKKFSMCLRSNPGSSSSACTDRLRPKVTRICKQKVGINKKISGPDDDDKPLTYFAKAKEVNQRKSKPKGQTGVTNLPQAKKPSVAKEPVPVKVVTQRGNNAPLKQNLRSKGAGSGRAEVMPELVIPPVRPPPTTQSRGNSPNVFPVIPPIEEAEESTGVRPLPAPVHCGGTSPIVFAAGSGRAEVMPELVIPPVRPPPTMQSRGNSPNIFPEEAEESTVVRPLPSPVHCGTSPIVFPEEAEESTVVRPLPAPVHSGTSPIVFPAGSGRAEVMPELVIPPDRPPPIMQSRGNSPIIFPAGSRRAEVMPELVIPPVRPPPIMQSRGNSPIIFPECIEIIDMKSESDDEVEIITTPAEDKEYSPLNDYQVSPAVTKLLPAVPDQQVQAARTITPIIVKAESLSSGTRITDPTELRLYESKHQDERQSAEFDSSLAPSSSFEYEANQDVEYDVSDNEGDYRIPSPYLYLQEIDKPVKRKVTKKNLDKTFKSPNAPKRRKTVHTVTGGTAAQSSRTCTAKSFKIGSTSRQTNLNKRRSNQSASHLTAIKKTINKKCSASEDNPPQRNSRRGQSSYTTQQNAKTNSNLMKDAPVFYPSEAEFSDPIAYITKITPDAAKFGMCKIVAPEGFKPNITLYDDVRFHVSNQYISRLFTRWGPASREMCAIEAHLASLNINFNRPPLLEGVEVDLPKFYRLVKELGGLTVINRYKKWSAVAEKMRLAHTAKLNQIYVKYLLPFDTMSENNRIKLFNDVDKVWDNKYKTMVEAMNPNPQKSQTPPLDESEIGPEEKIIENAMVDIEDCIQGGRQMNLVTFKKVAKKVMDINFSTSDQPSTYEIENKYWDLVTSSNNHLCVNSASIDTGGEGYGFTKNLRNCYGKHPWNLKMLYQNKRNMLRALGPLVGVTVPTLHLGMLFSTNCWHRDPHGLPLIDYMHTGPSKIWYGIPDEESANFRRAAELLCPTLCQNKSIWLPSDTVMIPPDRLIDKGVSVSRVVQKPGQFVVVFPQAYRCSISTGYTESESVYFATDTWLTTLRHVFNEMRLSSEPSMFSRERLLMAIACDSRTTIPVMRTVQPRLLDIILEEILHRCEITQFNVPIKNSRQNKNSSKRPGGAWTVREQDECEICRTTLIFSRARGLLPKKCSVCLQHALHLLKLHCRSEFSRVEVECFFDEAELKSINDRMQNRLLK